MIDVHQMIAETLAEVRIGKPEWVTDEDAWSRAKKKAAEQGKGDNYAYITSIYQSMTGQKKKDLVLMFGDPPDDQNQIQDVDPNVVRSEFEAEVAATELGGAGNPPPWVADEAVWDRAKEISQESYGEVRYPFVSWLYTQRLGGTKR